MTLADRVKEFVAENPGKSMSEIARALGVSQTNVSHACRRHQIETGHDHGGKQDVTNVGDPCPECGHIGNGTKDSRPSQFNGLPCIRRRRLCTECGHRFTTHEISEDAINDALNPETIKRRIAKKLIDAALGDDQ